MAEADHLSVSWRTALAWRMERQHLVERAKPADLPQVAADLCGLHAQVTSSAVLSLWARIDGLEREAVTEALWQERSLVKVWAARRTLHMLPAAELAVWVAALGTLPAGFRGASHDDVEAITSAVGQALDGRQLTREELAAAVGQITGSEVYAVWIRSGWGPALKAAAFRGLLCFAPGEGTQVRFTSPSSWLGQPLQVPATADGLRHVARRFLRGYGPATPADLGRWWMEARSGRKIAPMLEALGDDVVPVDVEGEAALALAADVAGLAAAQPRDVARLLPAFDPWVIGIGRREPMIDSQYVGRVYRQQGWVSPVILVNGRIAGVWKHSRTGGRVVVELEPFEGLPAWAERQVDAEIERLAAFLG
jgi:hypothetical protein